MFYATKYYIYNQPLQIKQAVHPVVGQTQYAPTQYEQPPRAFSLEVTAHVGDAAHRTPSVY